VGAALQRIRFATPFVLRSVDPHADDIAGRTVTGVRRLGKRIVLALAGERFVVIHLMIAGRLHWKAAGAKPAGKIGVAAFDFSAGTLVMTEAGTKERAAIHLPTIFSGIGNAYGDEILHRAPLSLVRDCRAHSLRDS
jgi:formamidopyrimidine-DNA glycosylase